MKMKKRTLFLALGCLCSLWSHAGGEEDTLRVVGLEELVVVGSPREHVALQKQPLAVSSLSSADLEHRTLTSLKDVSAYVPNFVMPDYGSRLTSSIYIRGIGSRINAPAVGLYVDDMPYLDKSAFDISLFDVERVDVLRGPQGTLYGRNTMGGLIKVQTRNPFLSPGTEVNLSLASRSTGWRAGVMRHACLNDHLAYSLGGYYEGASGFFRNETLDRKADGQKAGGVRARILYRPSDVWRLDWTARYDNSDEGGYAYGEYDVEQERVAPIRSNREGRYRRSMFHTGLHLTLDFRQVLLSSVTGYQYLNDRMFMDQDFSPADLFTLEQRQRLHAVTQELTLKNRPGSRWQWTSGLYGSWQGLHTSSPVGFGSDGMVMLSRAVNGYFPQLQNGMGMTLDFLQEQMDVPSDFDTPVWSGALFHQSTFTSGPWMFTLGLRLEHERMSLDYHTGCAVPYRFTLSYPAFHAEIPLEQEAVSDFTGKLEHHYTQLLPKVAVQYGWGGQNRVYASVSKGYRSGGYNLQMFSDIAQGGMRNAMLGQISTGVAGALGGLVQYGMPEAVVDRIVTTMNAGMKPADIRVEELVVYKPEQSWNYELGTRWAAWNGRLNVDLSLFYLRIRDQQITRFVDSGLGRILVNAGASDSYGAECSVQGHVSEAFTLFGSWGYTHAAFTDYDTASATGNGQDYSGRMIPYVPRYTFSFGGDYTVPLGGWLDQLCVGAHLTGTGRTYWTEDNGVFQRAYALLGAHVKVVRGKVSADLWGKNLTATSYNAFCFSNSAGGTLSYFAQKGKPFQLGMDLKWHF